MLSKNFKNSVNCEQSMMKKYQKLLNIEKRKKLEYSSHTMRIKNLEFYKFL